MSKPNVSLIEEEPPGADTVIYALESEGYAVLWKQSGRAELKQMQAKFAAPEIEINGKKVRYNSFQDLKDSKHFRLMSSLMRLVGNARDYRLIETFSI